MAKSKLWRKYFSSFPSWPCPSCQLGTLTLDKSTLKYLETGPSIAYRDYSGEPEDIIERFSGFLVCQNADCGEVAVIGGRTQHEQDYSQEMNAMSYERLFQPQFIIPAPPIFRIPSECPEVVSEELEKSFLLYWSDTGSSANRLRSAVEALLTERKIPRSVINKKGKRERLNLHTRIEKFTQKDSASGNYLLAIKWLGNAGSHSGIEEMSRDDLLEGFELFEHVIGLIYVQKDKQLQKVAKGINARKGPLKKKKKP